MPRRVVGIVESWDRVRLFGFIRAAHTTFFVHVTTVADGAPLAPGQAVASSSRRRTPAARARRGFAGCPRSARSAMRCCSGSSVRRAASASETEPDGPRAPPQPVPPGGHGPPPRRASGGRGPVMGRGRPTTWGRCAQEVPVLLMGKPVTVVCGKAEHHRGDHQGQVMWPPRVAAPPGRRQL